MNVTHRIGRLALTLVLGLLLAGATTGTASASTTLPASTKLVIAGGKSMAAPKASAATAVCPQPGQRVKTSTSPAVYLVDPQSALNWIPNADVYFSLWDSWNGIAVFDNLFTDCYNDNGFFTMSNAHLAKTSSSSAVYIWDAAIVQGGAYRWITSPTVFNNYGFSWSKIVTQSSVDPIAIYAPWD